MLKNYIKIALRNLIKNKVYSLINIIGLSVGLTGFILIYFLVQQELSFDKFNEKADRIYRPVEIQNLQGVGTQHVAVTMGPLAPAMKEHLPEVEEAARAFPWGSVVIKYGDKKISQGNIIMADNELFNIFSFQITAGDKKTPLTEPFTAVISETVASIIFGEEDPVGKSINVTDYYGSHDVAVSAVIKDVPNNSHIYFEIAFSTQSVIKTIPGLFDHWGNNSLATYILLREGASAEAVNDKLPGFLDTHKPPEAWAGLEMYIQPLSEIHLNSSHIIYETFNHNQSSITFVYAFSAIGLFILLLACINFMNLSTARSAKRAREVGMRKVLGSDRKSLIIQFIGESVIITVISFIISLLLVEFSADYFGELFGRNFSIDYSLTLSAQLFAIILLVGIISGSYPAFFLSSYRPTETLKGAAGIKSKGAFLRKGLVVLQFSIAIALIINTGLIYSQMDFIRNKELGYNKDQVAAVTIYGQQLKDKKEVFKNELLRNPQITNVSFASGLLGGSGSQGTINYQDEQEIKQVMTRYSMIGFDYLETMQMEMAEGRFFDPSITTDSSGAVIINETAAKEFGWTNKEAIGKKFAGQWYWEELTVIGVVKDFHFYKLTQKIEPLIMVINPDKHDYVMMKLSTSDIASTVSYIKNTFNKVYPGEDINFQFLDEYFANLYSGEQREGQLVASFSFFAIFIACMGLFGLASYTAEQKTKEIGIRKVLGAKVSSLIFMISKDFTKLVIIASIIAFPASYYSIQGWLDNFVYKADINFMIFIGGLLLVLLIALFTVSYQALKAASVNPVKSIRYE